jgi:hypothetical protein
MTASSSSTIYSAAEAGSEANAAADRNAALTIILFSMIFSFLLD